MDLVGRKLPVVGGVFLAGIATFISPLPANLLGLYFARAMANIGCIPLLWSPYGVDYVATESQGLLNAISSITTQLVTILATSGAI